MSDVLTELAALRARHESEGISHIREGRWDLPSLSEGWKSTLEQWSAGGRTYYLLYLTTARGVLLVAAVLTPVSSEGLEAYITRE